ncbi:MAG: hypothetical protein M3P49_13855 [Actinomycetota bacterium]|nr:hypothetical protein [Actinomycetota bacterium]
MAYITGPELLERLPQNGRGISPAQVKEALESAIEEVAALTGDTAGAGANARKAVANYAHADLLDIVFPRDARERDSESTVLRQNAERALAAHARAHPDPAPDLSRDEVPDGYSGVMSWG